jgi:Family of unknown function (DUF5824)
MPTLTTLLRTLESEYDTTRRPPRYFDVPKRGDLTPSEVRYVRKRFKDLVARERCVASDPNDPRCYEKTQTDLQPRVRKRKSDYLRVYESIFRNPQIPEADLFSSSSAKATLRKAPRGVARIALETGLPVEDLKEVYDIGVGAYASSGSRTGMSAEQWGYGRIYAFVVCYFCNEDGRFDSQRFLKNKTDFHIFERILQKMS